MAWRNEGLSAVCSSLPAETLARLVQCDSGLKSAIAFSWPVMRKHRAPSLQSRADSALLRLRRKEQSLLYEEFGSDVWRDSWVAGDTDVECEWLADADGLWLQGVGRRTLKLGALVCPPIVALSVAASGEAGSEGGCVCFFDTVGRVSVTVCIKPCVYSGVPHGAACIINGTLLGGASMWPESTNISFEFDWENRMLENVRLNGAQVPEADEIPFLNSSASYMSEVSIANTAGDNVKGRWEVIQVWSAKQLPRVDATLAASPFLSMLL
eukprot:TRINITY_DN28599_c0_g1_i1.p1 TRINITY_DN28599_c0_g1~~TRINITY_DN28599_c0_g1_i1.p1  ORF type:complete len:282 (-),score=23.71 TRINITY_DN28599_c0_g1_i1:469-1272(-)